MPKLTLTEHKKRKEATALRCLDEKGKPLNDASKSVAVQDKKEHCDINKIVSRLLKNGSVDPSLIRPEGRFGDFTNVVDFQETQNRVIRMNNQFMSLPADVRAKFENSPAKLIEFLSDSKNKEEAIRLGILPKPKIEHKKIETPEGSFWITTKDGEEINREKIKPAVPTPGT